MSELLRFFKDMRDNGYGLAEIAAQLGTSAIAEPVAGFAAMYDPAHGADAIREGMTYQPRSQAAQEYSQSVGNAAKTAIKPAMPIIDTWKKGVDIAGQYSPAVGAALRTVPTAIGIAMGAKPALQAGRQVSEGLGAMQGRMIANANAPRTLNTGYMGQRGAIGLTNDFDNSDEIKIIADYLGQSPESMLVNRDLYTKKQGAINSLVSRYEQMDDFSGAYYPTSYGYISISPSAKSNGQWQLTSFDKKMNPLSDQGEMPKNKALTEFFKTIKPNKYGNSTPVQTTPKRPLTEFEQAHQLAQQRAALPVNQMGLDLPANNTAMDRARAMGWDVDNPVYTGISPREGYGNSELWNKLERKTDPNMTGFDRSVFSSTSPKVASGYTGVVNLSPDIQHRIAFDGLTEAKKLQNAEGFQPTFIGEKMLDDLGDDFTFNDVKNYLSDNDISPDDIMEFSKVIDTDKYHDVGSSIIPMYVNKKDYLNLDAGGSNWDEVIRAGSYDEDNLLDSLVKQINEKTGKNISRDDVLSERGIEYDGQMDRNITTDDLKEIAKDYGLSGVEIKNVIDSAGNTRVKANTVATTKGHTLRALSAAFDPFNRDSSNLLATTAPLVPTTALGAYMYNEKRKKSQGKQ